MEQPLIEQAALMVENCISLQDMGATDILIEREKAKIEELMMELKETMKTIPEQKIRFQYKKVIIREQNEPQVMAVQVENSEIYVFVSEQGKKGLYVVVKNREKTKQNHDVVLALVQELIQSFNENEDFRLRRTLLKISWQILEI